MITLTTINDSIVPPVGVGTFPLQGEDMAKVMVSAAQVGYRLFDTSDDYEGEMGIGLGIKELVYNHVCTREDLFIQTKVSNNDSYNDEPLRGIYFTENSSFMKRHSVESIIREKVENSLRDLQTDYLDSVLLHFPYEPFYGEMWKVLIKLKEEGLVRYIGVSNFHPKHIDKIYNETGVLPAMNEIYLSPIGAKCEQVEYANDKGIILMTYSPLMDLSRNKVPMERFEHLCEKYKKTPAQIVLRWNIERGSIPLPKSSKPNRLKENIDVLDFELTSEEVDLITSLNTWYQYLPESLNCPGI